MKNVADASWRLYLKQRYEFIHHSFKQTAREAIAEAHELFPRAALVDVEPVKHMEIA